ncbi:hypothetical protein BBJ28_00025337, partial [Nothophytophthora sp. Chile5]
MGDALSLMERQLEAQVEAELKRLLEKQVEPRAHQTMLKTTHGRAVRVGKGLIEQLHKPPRKGGLGIFRRRSTKSNKKKNREKLTKAKSDGRMTLESMPLAWDIDTRASSTAGVQSLDVSLKQAVAVFHKVVALYFTFYATFKKTDRFVFHLASMRRMYLDLLQLNEKLDDVVARGGLNMSVNVDPAWKVEGMTWQTQLGLDRETEETELSVKAAKNALPFARNMKAHEPMEALTLLKFELDFFKPGNSTRHATSMKKVFFSVVRSSNGRVARIPDWYIPPYTLNYTREVVNGMTGPVGTAHRGIWVDRKPPEGKKPAHDSKDGQEKPMLREVVVKRILIEADGIDFFRKEVETWYALDHANILKLYGASHCSRPAILVLEVAVNGPLVSYLLEKYPVDTKKHGGQQQRQGSYRNRRHALWSLYLEAAQGLNFLHENKLVHNNLKSDNILVADDGHAKLTDFGLGMLTLQNQLKQDNKRFELGWRPPECRSKRGRPTFKGDIYSFGLCLLDALVPQLSSVS